MDRRTFLKTTAAATAGLCAAGSQGCGFEPPVLYNGIQLTHSWPPRRPFTIGVQIPPYLQRPPAVIPIDIGRQLFVDDFLIARTTLQRHFHRTTYLSESPVLMPDKPWEEAGTPAACAMPFSDAVIYDTDDRLFKCWYMAGLKARHTCLAISEDGIRWTKPDWGVVAGTNIVVPFHLTHGRDSHTVFRDRADTTWRFRMQSSGSGQEYSPQWLYRSRDGIRWERFGETPSAGDRTTMFFNPFRNVWVYSLRSGGEVGGRARHRLYQESAALVPETWQPVFWTSADAQDSYEAGANGHPPQLYNLDCVAYESVLLGLFTIFRGDVADRPKLNDVVWGMSRDGFHWWRPDRRPFISVGARGAWNAGNVQSAGGCCLIVGDQLHFYVSGRQGIPGTPEPGTCTTGIALLRRDGFASMDAAETHGTLTTRLIKFSGRYLFVNAAVPFGDLRVEVLGPDRRVMEPFSMAECEPVSGDATKQQVRWARSDHIAAAAGRSVRLRFTLRNGSLYSFWVSPSPDGDSRGYPAAGSVV
jgi:hypothetical protein